MSKLQKLNANSFMGKKDFFYICFLFALVIMPLAPFLFFPYLYSDDFYYLYPSVTNPTKFSVNSEKFFSQHDAYLNYFLSIGRPSLYFLTKFWSFIGLDPEGITFLKSLSVALHCLTMMLLFKLMKRLLILY